MRGGHIGWRAGGGRGAGVGKGGLSHMREGCCDEGMREGDEEGKGKGGRRDGARTKGKG